MKGINKLKKTVTKILAIFILSAMICSIVKPVMATTVWCTMNRYGGGRLGNLYRAQVGDDCVYDFDMDNKSDYYCMGGDIPLGYTDNLTRVSIDNSYLSIYSTRHGLTQTQSRNAVKWLSKNMFYVAGDAQSNSKDEIEIMKTHLESIMKEEYGSSALNLSKFNLESYNDQEFIGVLQQFVVWQFCYHANRVNYYTNRITSGQSIKNFVYGSGENVITDDTKAEQAYQLYNSLVNQAVKYAKGETTFSMLENNQQGPTISLEKNTNTNAVVSQGQGDGGYYYLIKGIKLVGNANYIDSITGYVSIGIPNCTGVIEGYYIGDNKTNPDNLKSLVGKTFDIKVKTNTEVLSTVNANFTYGVNAKFIGQLKSFTCNACVGSGKQPILETRKDVKQSSSSATITTTKPGEDEEYIDLALTKQITKIERNGTTIFDGNTNNRLNNISTVLLKAGKDDNAQYMMDKTPLEVQPNDLVTYKLTVYNEGEENAIVKQITDYLPNGVQYVSSTGNSTTNSGNKVIINVGEQTINRYNNQDTPPSYSVNVVCKVSNNVTKGIVLTNMAEISDYGYKKGSQYYRANQTDSADRDSFQDNIDTEDYDKKIEKIDKGKLSNINKKLGDIEDDVDFEQIIVKEFDLALRKYIKTVNGKAINSNLYGDRTPTVYSSDALGLMTGSLTTAKYRHQKNPVEVETGDRIVYGINIYNEGNVDGVVKKIVDYLPTGLKLVEPEKSVINSYYGWSASSNANGTSVARTTNEFNISGGTPFEFLKLASIMSTDIVTEIAIECEVVSTENNKILTNVAEIADYGYMNGDTYVKANEAGSQDRDSHKEDADIISSNPMYINQMLTGYYNEKYDESNPNQKIYTGREDDDDFENIVISNKFDLALRKYITKVNNVAITESREPQIVEQSVNKLIRENTAGYYHTKEPVKVHMGDTVTYTLRIYNESSINGVVKELVDYLPEGLELADDETKWEVDSSYNVTGITRIKTKSSWNEITIPASYGSVNYQKYLDGTLQQSEKFWRDVTVKCKVTSGTHNKILTNVAEISNYGYYIGETFKNASTRNLADRDSWQNEVRISRSIYYKSI